MKHQLLLQQLGENATTAKDPVAEVLRVDGHMLCQVPLWGVGEVDRARVLHQAPRYRHLHVVSPLI